MKLPVTVLLFVALTLGGCGTIRESRFNPLNWFGQSEESTAQSVIPQKPADTRPLVDQVIAMEVARKPGGAIVRATGLPPTQAWWDASLVAENDGEPVNGVLTFRFVVEQPIGDARVSTPRSREVTAAVYLSDIKLAEVRQIVVLGLNNSRSSRR